MARIIYSGLIDSIRGSIGGTTFQSNKYGYTCKRKPNMTKPWTADQKTMQIYFAQAVRAWRSLTDTYRNNWITWAATNPQYAKHNPSAQLSGFACFVKWHAFEFMCGGVLDTAPALTIPATPTITLKIILAAGVLSLQIICPSGVEDWNLAFFMSRPFGVAQNFIGTRPRFLTNSTDANTTRVITTFYTSKYGALPVLGDRIAVDYVRFMESGGQVNSRVQEVITVTAS
jgi:hypothetical protein